MTRLAELRGLLAKRTFTMPMQVLRDNGKPVDMTPDEDGYVYIPELASLGDTGICFTNDYEDRQHDAALIVAAVNALPALLDVAEAAAESPGDCFEHAGNCCHEWCAKCQAGRASMKRMAAALGRLMVPNVIGGEK